jgi:hypothetical protein
MSEPGDYDRAARLAITTEPEGFLRWLVPGLPPEMTFTRWLETRTTPLPGEQDRICDTIAELNHRDGLGVPWALIVEAQTRPASDFTERALEYLLRVRQQFRHGPHNRDRFNVGVALILLTGSRPAGVLEMTLPGTDVRMDWRYPVRSVADEDATEHLTKIAAGSLPRGLLCWVPLMKGGTDPETLAGWLRLAGQEPDANRRNVLAILTLTFAELTPALASWSKMLEGWNVEKSILWESIRQKAREQGLEEGEAKGLRNSLRQIFKARFPDANPAAVLQVIETQADPDVLNRWIQRASLADSFEQFQASLSAN